MIWYFVAGALLAAMVMVIMRERRRVPASRLAATKPPTIGPKGGAGDSGAASRKAIPASVRAELDDKPEFWLERFHQTLAAVGAEYAVGERIETRTWANELVMSWEDRGYVDCPCSKCRRICS